MDTKTLLKVRFDELTAQVLAKRASVAELKKKREFISTEINRMQEQVSDLSREISDGLGGELFLALCKERSAVAKAMGAMSVTEL